MQSNLFLIARHGETPANDKHEFVSHSDISLNEKGEKQAHEAGDFIAHLSLPITHVISSPLNRAQETAAIICNVLHIPEFYVDDRVTDLDVGDLTGKNEDENPIDEYLNDPDRKFPNGESINDFQDRQHSFAKELLDQISSGEILAGSVLVVSHSPIIAYWHNIQNPKAPIGIRGLVRPGGVVSVTDDDVFPLFGRKPTPEEIQNKNIHYPPDHQPGMKVPKGGSMCKNCKFLKDPEGKICGNKDFIRWNGSDVIPGEIDSYCSDWFVPQETEKYE